MGALLIDARKEHRNACLSLSFGLLGRVNLRDFVSVDAEENAIRCLAWWHWMICNFQDWSPAACLQGEGQPLHRSRSMLHHLQKIVTVRKSSATWQAMSWTKHFQLNFAGWLKFLCQNNENSSCAHCWAAKMSATKHKQSKKENPKNMLLPATKWIDLKMTVGSWFAHLHSEWATHPWHHHCSAIVALGCGWQWKMNVKGCKLSAQCIMAKVWMKDGHYSLQWKWEEIILSWKLSQTPTQQFKRPETICRAHARPL